MLNPKKESLKRRRFVMTKAKKATKGEATTHSDPKPGKPKNKKGQTYECRVCGYRVVVDETCGCAEEHVFVCCGQPMKRKRAAAK
jgi:rubrerythrin